MLNSLMVVRVLPGLLSLPCIVAAKFLSMIFLALSFHPWVQKDKSPQECSKNV